MGSKIKNIGGLQFSIDTSKMVDRHRRIAKEIAPAIARQAVGAAGLELLRMAMMEPPTVPIYIPDPEKKKTSDHVGGMLRGSASLFVNNELMHVSSFGIPGAATRDHVEALQANRFVAVLGFNTPYAARLHEHPEYNFSEPSAGGKYVEQKLLSGHDRLLRVIAEHFRQFFGD